MMPDIADAFAEIGAAQPMANGHAAEPVSFGTPLRTEPNAKALDGSSLTINLAGQVWPIPLLAPRQNRVVVPAVSKVTKRMRELAEAKITRMKEARQTLETKTKELDYLQAKLAVEGAPLIDANAVKTQIAEVTQAIEHARPDAEQLAILLANITAEDKAILREDGALRKKVWAVTDFPTEMITDADADFIDTVAAAVYGALTRAHPALTRAEFDDMPIGLIEMIDAIGVVAQQTGMMRKVEPESGPLAGASRSPSSPTGTP
jgi:hypothetical protein